jgi:hypothetical protein
LVSTTPAVNFPAGIAGVVDTGGKFATVVNHNGPDGILTGFGEIDS